MLTFDFAKKLAERYHRNIKSCYFSPRAYWVQGYSPQEDKEWIKNRRGKWNGYPPAKWTNPALAVEEDKIVITTNRHTRITLPAISKRFQNKMSFVAPYGYLFSTYTKTTLNIWGLDKKNNYCVKRQITLPEGYIWTKDKDGLKVLRLTDKADFHPNATCLDLGAEYLVSELEKNFQKRLAEQVEINKTKKLYQRALKTGVRVTLADSLASGNCKAGTESFCRTHKLDINKSYSPLYLLKFKDNIQRVRLAINCAIKRHMVSVDTGAEMFYP